MSKWARDHKIPVVEWYDPVVVPTCLKIIDGDFVTGPF